MNNLLVKALVGLAFLLLVLGAALFVAAGSLQYWQAWIYLAVFGGSSALITAYLVQHDRELLYKRHDRGGRGTEGDRQRALFRGRRVVVATC